MGWGWGVRGGGVRRKKEQEVGGHISFLGQVFLSHCQVVENLFVQSAGRHGHGRLQRGSGPSLHHAGVRKHASAPHRHR